MPTPITNRDPGDESDTSIEEARLLSWRFDQLVAAGYPHDVAEMLAERSDIDWRLARRLLRQGATVHQALRILT